MEGSRHAPDTALDPRAVLLDAVLFGVRVFLEFVALAPATGLLARAALGNASEQDIARFEAAFGAGLGDSPLMSQRILEMQRVT